MYKETIILFRYYSSTYESCHHHQTQTPAENFLGSRLAVQAAAAVHQNNQTFMVGNYSPTSNTCSPGKYRLFFFRSSHSCIN